MAQDPSDQALVNAALEGNRSAFDALIDRYWNGAVSMAHARTRSWDDAEDVAQDAFVLAYDRLPQLREPARFAGWFFTIVARTCVEIARRRPRRPVAVDNVEGMTEPFMQRKDRHVDRQTLRDQVQGALAALPPRYRPVVLLRYGQGLSVKAIGESLDMPRGTVVSQIFRANRILRRQLRHLVRER